MSKILHFKNNQDDGDEILQMQESALKSAIDGGEESGSTVLPINSDDDNVELLRNPGKNSFLEKNVVITGSISSVTTIEIEGQVNGNVSCTNIKQQPPGLYVGPGGYFIYQEISAKHFYKISYSVNLVLIMIYFSEAI